MDLKNESWFFPSYIKFKSCLNYINTGDSQASEPSDAALEWEAVQLYQHGPVPKPTGPVGQLKELCCSQVPG